MKKASDMKPDFKGIALEIIELHRKTTGGIFNWQPYYISHLKDEEYLSEAIYAKQILVGKELLTYPDDEKKYLTILTEEGQNWEGFEAEERKLKLQEKAEKAEAWPKRHWLLFAVITGSIGFLFGIAGKGVEKILWPEQKKQSTDSTYRYKTSALLKSSFYDTTISNPGATGK